MTGAIPAAENQSVSRLALLLLFAAGGGYEIGAGDVLHVVVAGQAEMTGDFRVDPEGVVNFPILGRVKASDHTVQELERKLTTLLADGYLKRPQVSVSVAQYGSQKVYVTGEVPKPGTYALKTDRSLLALLGEIGSLGGEAGHEAIVIRRSGEVAAGPILPSAPSEGGAAGRAVAGQPLDIPGAEVFRVNLRDLQAGNPERNILLEPGDTVYFPQAAMVYVTGNVARPGPYKYQDGMTLLQVLTLAGGVTERGASGRTRIVRIVGGKKQETKAKLTDAIQPEDLVVVPERFF